ncbi:MAG UNVERIFIED_CONTAM: carbohydrate ABC transporter permease [Anaerolineae bacterium]
MSPQGCYKYELTKKTVRLRIDWLIGCNWVAAQRTPQNADLSGMVGIILGVIVWLPQWFELAEFYGFFLNSVIVTVGTLAISISIGCGGYALARYSGVTGVVILFVALAFRALPRMVFILPYYFFAQISGLYDTYFLLIITFVAINQPFTIWMLRSFFMEIPRELEEAAMIDGCNRYTAFLRVILPIAWTGIITTSLFTLLLAYNEFRWRGSLNLFAMDVAGGIFGVSPAGRTCACYRFPMPVR